MFQAITIANAFIAFSDPEKGDIISNLKVQKLLYYAQGIYLAVYNEPLFEEDIIKWQYGPVVPTVYSSLKRYGSEAIPVDDAFDFSVFNKNQMDVLQEINMVFGQFSAIRLMNMTHQEPPYNNTLLRGVITHQELIKYFSTQLED